MADPLFTPAVVGAVVSLFFTEVIDAAKSAYRYRKKCKIVLDSVNKLQPHIDAARRNSAHLEEAQANWLNEIEGLLVKARSRAIKGRDETKSEKRKRVMKVWRWGKLPSELMDIVQQIEKAQQNVVFVAALETIIYMNSLKNKKSFDFVPQQLPPHIVGVGETFNRLKASVLASEAKDKPSYLGLHGRGGAGKTMLAKMLHNDEQIIEKYGAHSVLWLTIGLDARVSDLYKTMGQFLKDGVFEETYAHQSLKDQRRFLWNAYSKKKVFLILDDVWQEPNEQNHEMMYWLNIATAPGSATLITTRSTSVLSKVHAESEVVLGLLEEDSWKLFSAHAFSEGTLPSTICEELAREVCKECKGLPLALKVIGSAMVGKVNEEEWSSALYDLKRSEPILDSSVDVELFDRLKLSYDMLKGDVLKTCFLYLAAFPEDYEIPTTTLFRMWNAEGLFGSLDAKDASNRAQAHLEILEKCSLIHWNRKREYVQVHDILRDLALYIIDKAGPGECASKCFFHPGKTFKSFPSGKSLQAIKRMSFMNCTISEWPEKLQVPNLEVCLLSGIILDTNVSKFSGFQDMTSLKYLDLSHCHFKSEINLLRFKELDSFTNVDLSFSNLLKELLESIDEFNSLMDLNLSGCTSLRELPENIDKFKHMILLDLERCISLDKLPENIPYLKSLESLNLRHCESLKELPGNIGNLKHLTWLDLLGCRSLKKIPESICHLDRLEDLDLADCDSLKELPENIGNLKHLIRLDLQGCKSLGKLPECISNLESLQSLSLWGCDSLKELPKNIGNLKRLTRLDLRGCESLDKLPESISNLESLKDLELWRCQSLEEFPKNIGNLKHLIQLNLEGCKSLNKLPESISNLDNLEGLDLSLCESLKELPKNIGNLKHLTRLYLVGCISLDKLPKSISNLKNLEGLDLSQCESLMELPENIGNLKHLVQLKLQGCKVLQQLPESISNLDSLEGLNLWRCASLKELPGNIGNLKHLIQLKLEGCNSLDKLPESISNMEDLEGLDLSQCESLKELPENIGNLKHLTHLDLLGCISLDKLPRSICNMESLVNLDLCKCKTIEEIPKNIGNLKHLTQLKLQGCKVLQHLPESISNLDNLERLNLQECEPLKELPGNIGNLKHLSMLHLQGCKSLEKLPESMSNLQSLEVLNLNHCESLKELPSNIGNLKHLRWLDLQGCKSLDKLPESISNLESLESLDLRGCESLKELPENIGSLKHLIIFYLQSGEHGERSYASNKQ
ncbi:hypothetical protein M758_6G067500 [Ceratodon purpureus]|nr:hypothetical protein M758_6G067500 [Ceratodon purpureus]